MQEAQLSVSELEGFETDSQIMAIQPQLDSVVGPALRLDPAYIKPTYSTCVPMRLLRGVPQTISINFLAHCGDRFVVRLHSDGISAACSPILTRMEEEVYCCVLRVSPYIVGNAISQLEICYAGASILYVVLYFTVESAAALALSGPEYFEGEQQVKTEDVSAESEPYGRVSVGLDRRSQYTAYCSQTDSPFSPAILETSEIKHTAGNEYGSANRDESHAFVSYSQENDFLPESLVYNSTYAKNMRIPRIRKEVLGKTAETQTYNYAVSSAIERSVEKYEEPIDNNSARQKPVYPGDTITNPSQENATKANMSQGSLQNIGEQRPSMPSIPENPSKEHSLTSNSLSMLKKRSAIFNEAAGNLVQPREESAADDNSVSELSQEFVFQPIETIPGQVIFAPADSNFPEIACIRVKNFIGADICCAVTIHSIDIANMNLPPSVSEHLISDPTHFKVDNQVKVAQNGITDLVITFAPSGFNKISISTLKITHLDTEVAIPLIGCCGCISCEFSNESNEAIAMNDGQCDLQLRYVQDGQPVEEILLVGKTTYLENCESIACNCYLLNRLLAADFAELFCELKAIDWEEQVRRVITLCEEQFKSTR